MVREGGGGNRIHLGEGKGQVGVPAWHHKDLGVFGAKSDVGDNVRAGNSQPSLGKHGRQTHKKEGPSRKLASLG